MIAGGGQLIQQVRDEGITPIAPSIKVSCFCKSLKFFEFVKVLLVLGIGHQLIAWLCADIKRDWRLLWTMPVAQAQKSR